MDEYFIKKETLDAIADKTNVLSGKTDAVSPSTMISDLVEINGDVATLSSMIKEATDLIGQKQDISPYMLMHRIIERTIEGFLTIDESLHIEEIGPYAFRSCSSLTTVNFPAVTSIGDFAFQGCSNLTTVDFPAVTSIGKGAFNDCSNLTTVILRDTKTVSTIGTFTFYATPISYGTGYIYVPSALIEFYKTAANWSEYASQFRALEEYIDVVGGVI